MRSTDGDRGGRGDLLAIVRGKPNRHSGPGIWQTPVSDDAVDRARGKVNSRGEPKLSAQVKLWPTPHGMSKDGKSNGPSGNELGRAVNRSLWPTATACMHKGRSPAALTRKSGADRSRDRLDHAMQAAEGSGSLNPEWVEWLMGYPIGWTDLEA